MALSEDTQWGVGIGVVILGAIGSGVWYLSSNQTAMENRLRENITDTEERLAQRIERVDSRLTEQIAKVDTGLRAVEGETAPLAGLEARLTKTIESSETRLSQGQQDVEKRLTAQIEKIDDRLLQVEGQSARLTTIVKSSSAPTQWIGPSSKGAFAEMMANLQGRKVGELQTVTNIKVLKALKDSGIDIEYFAVPAWNQYFSGPYTEAVIEALQTPEIEPVVNPDQATPETPLGPAPE